MRLRNDAPFSQVASGLDYWLLGMYFAIVFFSLACIFSSEHISFDAGMTFWDSARAIKQLKWLGLSLFAGIFIIFVINPKIYDILSPLLYIFAVFLLVAVIFFGTEIKGSHSWFAFGSVRFQPAEFAKITTALVVASIMSQPTFSVLRIDNRVKVLALIALPILCIFAERETGSALVFASLYLVLYKEGFPGWLIVVALVAVVLFIMTLVVGPYWALGALAAFVVGVYFYSHRQKGVWKILLLAMALGVGWIFSVQYVFAHVLQEHQRGRIEVLLGLKDDPTGLGYNVSQSMIAIGSGGFTGKGYLQGTQTTLGFIPEQSTDFIFCTVGEEFGFLGCAALILLFTAFICRICVVATRSKDKFCEIFGYAFAGYIAFHLMVNIGMTIGLMPVIGIPLPYFSYGGSSLLCFSLMLFIFEALLTAARGKSRL